MLLFFVEMGNCQSRFCCTAANSVTAPPKTPRSEKSANIEANPKPDESLSDQCERINASIKQEFERLREIHSNLAKEVEETRESLRSRCAAKDVCDDDPNHPPCVESNKVEDYTETATNLNTVDEETRRRFLRQLQRAAWIHIYKRFVKAQEVALARMKNEVNEDASTSAEDPSCNVPSSEEWLIKHPCLFDHIIYSEWNHEFDEENCSQPSEEGRVAISMKLDMVFKKKPKEPPKELEFESINPVLELNVENVENHPGDGSPSNGSILFLDMDRQPSTEEINAGDKTPSNGAIRFIDKDRQPPTDENPRERSPSNGSIRFLDMDRQPSTEEINAGGKSPSNGSNRFLDMDRQPSTQENPDEGSPSNGSILFLDKDRQPSTEGRDDRISCSSWVPHALSPCPSPSPGATTRVLRERPNNSVESLVSNSGSKAEESALPQGQTTSPSPESRANSRQGGFLRGVYSRIARRRSNRVFDVTSPGTSKSSSNNAINGNPESSNVRAQRSPQNTKLSTLTRTWLNILGRGSPPTSGRVTRILVRPYDESPDENGRRLVTSPASVEHNTTVSPSPVRSPASDSPTFKIEDDIEICSITSSPTFDARHADFGVT